MDRLYRVLFAKKQEVNMTGMMLMMVVSCAQEHVHEELVRRVERLEQKVVVQEANIQRLKSMETYKKNAAPLCENEQPDVYAITKGTFQRYVEKEETRPRIYPHQKDGEIVGLRIANVPEDWRSCDMEDGDLLLSINDVQLRTPRTLQSLYKRIETFSEVRIRRKRKEEEHVIRFRVLPR